MPRYYYDPYHHHHNHYGRRYTLMSMFDDFYGVYRPWSLRESIIGFGLLIVVVVPIVIILNIIKLISIATAPVVVTTTLTSSLAGAASISAGGAAAVGVTIATLGFAALVMYGIVGVGYLYSAAKEAYNSEKSGLDLVASSFIPQEDWSFRGVLKSAGAVLWLSVMLMGVLSGKAVKAAVQAYKGSSDVDITLTPLDASDLALVYSDQTKSSITLVDKKMSPVAGQRTNAPSFFSSASSEASSSTILPDELDVTCGQIGLYHPMKTYI
jgi:hypothetical protein